MEREPAGTLETLAARRDATLARIVERVAQDERVVAVWLTGSFGRGEDDAWSDLDLHLAIEDAYLAAWWDARMALYEAIAPPLFVQPEKPSNAQEGGHFQLVYMPGPVEVDWNVGPVSLATRPPTSRMLLARREIPIEPSPVLDADERRERLQRSTDFFWAMTPIAIKYAGRGATTSAVDQIDLLVRGISEVWWVLRGTPNLVSRNPRIESELAAILPVLDPVIEPSGCLGASEGLMAAMGTLRPDLEGEGVRWPDALVSQTVALVEIAREVTGGGRVR
ncbi:MAG: hypothetical protein ACTHMX_16665 [Thermomicrobiales bacterium]